LLWLFPADDREPIGLPLSNSQIDKLGQKLRTDCVDAQCLRDLEIFRSLYAPAYQYVENVLVNHMGLSVTGRPSKSTVAIVEKLKRETIRLNQIQDIAGCRVLVPNLAYQDHVVANMQIMLADAQIEIDDKRSHPTNGYRAIHVIAKKFGRPVEIQVRTRLQHAWAELSEKIADASGHSIKYGYGDEEAIRFLARLSEVTAKLEMTRHLQMDASARKARLGKSKNLVKEIKALNEQERVQMRELRSIFAGRF
jgi:ppGpp synthetase/RelA/SpoT-type nucleotidyltranferase